MTGHRMIGMAKECFAIFGGNARGSQSTRERVAKVVDANQRQSRVVSGALALDLTRPIVDDWILLRIAHVALGGEVELLDDVIAVVEAAIQSRQQPD